MNNIASIFVLGLALLAYPHFASSQTASCWACTQNGICINQTSGAAECLSNPGGNCTFGAQCSIAGCFAAGALVDTREGKAPIEAIEIGDQVLSLDEDGELTWAAVTNTYRALNSQYYLINGTLRVTALHPFSVAGEWINAEDLVVGTQLVGSDGANILVSSVERVDFGVRVYNLEVDGTHTFFVNGVLVHNKEPTPGQE